LHLLIPRQKSTWLLIGGLLALLAGLGGGAFLPLYTDEIGWRFQERAWLDGVDIAMNDICGPNTLANPVFYMWPARWFSATINMALDNPMWVRATGVVLALVLVGMVWRLVRALEQDGERRQLLLACAFALLATGTLPMVLTMSRPEQPVFLAVVTMLIITLSGRERPVTAMSVWLKGIAIVVLAAIALSYHLKGVLYSGVALVCVASLAPGRQHLLPRVVAGAALLTLVALGADYWVARFQCPADPMAAARLAKNNLASTLANGGTLISVAAALLENANPLQYVRAASPAVIPMSAWYPIHLFSPAQAVLTHFAHYIAWLTVTLMILGGLFAFWREQGMWQGFKALFTPRPLILLALAGTLVAWAASQATKNPYEGGHVFPAWIAAMLLAFTLGGVQQRPSLPTLRKLATGLVALAIVSQAFTLGRVVPHLTDAAQDSGFLPRQPYSVSLADYNRVREDIAQAMAAENFPTNRRLNRVLLDDVAYMALQGSYRPLHHLGVVHVWNGSIDDPAAYLVSRRSDGAVAVCEYLWPEAQRVASRAGEICAIGPEKLTTLAGGRRFVEPADR
jgi:hypothetical protein